MPNVTISFNVKRRTGLLNSSQVGAEADKYLLEELQAAVSGTNQSDGIIYSANDDVSLGSTAYAGPAIAALVMASSSGSVGGSIAGTAITVTWATSDTASSTALAAAIRASTAVNRKVTATNVAMRVTLASVTAGQYIDICGVRFTAVNGTPADFGQFDMSGTDTADATSLALAINRHPSTAMRYRAVSSAGLVYVFPTTARTLSPTQDKWAAITNPGGFTTFTINTAVPTAGAVTAIIAAVPGDIGNEVRLTASGTNVTAITNGTAGFLGNGTGGGTVPYFNLP
jgi:hypothetical protein